jgi:hypothetical protein
MPAARDSKGARPPHRRLRVFAFDPSLSGQIETANINQLTLKIPWDDSLQQGPTDEYLEVVDVDPASNLCYTPVDLNQLELLAQDGLSPSEGNPQFHQQMAYAVARTTIRHFEEALGRRALWSIRRWKEGDQYREEFVRRLRVYPHALREANAYYSPDKKALLFGYFPASRTDPGCNLPGGMVFSCLSHDIVAHETTHALLDGLHRRFIEPSNVDVWAIHEAFADIVALFQHFSYPEVLRHQIAGTQGDLQKQNLLAQLAHQFGQAIGRYGALRDSLGEVDPKTQVWTPKVPDPAEIDHTTEPHARGAILVAAVFEAFLTIYRWRIADLLRIATGGSGVLPPGELHPDLVGRLAAEASKTAGHVLQMCIRALDYCPPVDLTFGEYLRALITADVDLVGDDPRNYRLAMIEAFRKRGIYPQDVRSLSEESLLWNTPTPDEQQAYQKVFRGPGTVRQLVPDWGLTEDRERIWKQSQSNAAQLHGWLAAEEARKAVEAARLELSETARPSIYRDKTGKRPAFEIHSVRPARRIGPDGQTLTDLVVEITQRRRGYYDRTLQEKVDQGSVEPKDPPDFVFRGGCTLLVNLETGRVDYCIAKSIASQRRLEAQRRFLTTELNPSLRATYFGDARRIYFDGGAAAVEPLALLHRSYREEE